MALPTIGRDLGLELGGLQWVMNAYLLALGALIITGGSLGDLYGRRKVFNYGLVGFAATSFLCAVAPGGEALIGARVLQGVSAALLIPTSLAIVEASFAEEDRGVAIGAWAGWSGISSAIGPFLGGWLVDVGSWRLVFGVVVVVAVVAAWLGVRHLPESRGPQAHGARPDWIGSALVSLGLAGITHALVEAGGRGLDDPAVAATDSSLRQRSCGPAGAADSAGFAQLPRDLSATRAGWAAAPALRHRPGETLDLRPSGGGLTPMGSFAQRNAAPAHG